MFWCLFEHKPKQTKPNKTKPNKQTKPKQNKTKGIIIFTLCWIILLILGANFLWTDLSWEAWYSLSVVCVTLTLLIKDVLPPHFVLVLSMTSLVAARVLTVNEALAGFSTEGLVTIAVLFVVAKAIEVNKAIDFITKYLLRRPKKIWDAQLRVMLPIGLASAFMNNTPIVAMMIPVIQSWSQRSGLPASKLLMPLSYSAILGGTCTIIGTSTNLIVYDLAMSADPTLVLGFFEVGYAGFPVFVLGIAFVIIFSRWLLPDRGAGDRSFHNNPREYTLETVVGTLSPLVGKTLEETGLTTIPGVSILKLERNQTVMMLPDPTTTKVQAGDLIVFEGIAESVQEVFTFDGILTATEQVSKVAGSPGKRCLVEVVLAPHSPLIGNSVKGSAFRNRYNAVIIAVHRRRRRILGKLEEIVFEPGDGVSNSSFFHHLAF
jgi:di/tricarboxylate transporter